MNLAQKLCEVIKEALHEMDRCPEDSIRDIWNEKLEEWKTGLCMDHHFNIDNAELSDPSEERIVDRLPAKCIHGRGYGNPQTCVHCHEAAEHFPDAGKMVNATRTDSFGAGDGCQNSQQEKS